MASTSYFKNDPLKDKTPGSLDVEVFHEEETDLYKHHKACQKHPDHKEFIPVDAFDITHLPSDFQDKDIVEYIKLVAQLTVRLTVRYISPERPATVPRTDTPYPGFQKRGKKVTSFGTGMIAGLNHLSKEVIIKTAAHVVFDKEEAQHTSCHLFYDNGIKPAACKTAIELNCRFDIKSVNTITDESFFKGEIDDVSLLDTLDSKSARLCELYNIIKDKFARMSDFNQNPLTFIVSHPHGCSKTISIGRCEDMDDNLDDIRFLYTTPTCQGSSGAAVFCVDKRAWNLNSTHSGRWNGNTRLNRGSCRYASLNHFGGGVSSTWRWEYPDVRLSDSQRLSFPPEFNFNLMLDYIRMWSQLCVDVCVHYVSEQRPEFWPGSELDYPCYKERQIWKRRRGRGWVDRVDIYPNQTSPDKTCDCDSCRNSLMPERKFAHIYMLTSTSLVFDQTEGTETACNFFRNRLYKLSETQPVCSDVETDRSQLVFVTHDLLYAEKLKNLLEHVLILKDKIQDKLFSELSASPISIKVGLYGENTVGRCVRVGKHLVYTNKAEKADVGAPIIVLGNKHLQMDVFGHTGKYSHDPTLGYSRYLDYQYK